MENFVPTFTDITLWQKQNYVNTGGTRAKFVALNREGDKYYFKGSKETQDGDVRYPLEFWSEILSSKIGQLLGFNLLDYNIGYDSKHKQKIGCLSKSMIDEKQERLTEGITYLKGFSPEYQPKTDKKKYTFQFISDALKHHSIEIHLPHLIDIIIFDCIVGNSDRHQENWGFIRRYIEITLKTTPSKRELINEGWIKKVKRIIFRKKKKYTSSRTIRIDLNDNSLFSPIYDSGCCLAREKTEEEILQMHTNPQLIEKYINRGKSEIHWNEKKITHFQLVQNLLECHKEKTMETLNLVKEKYSLTHLTSVVNNIDNDLPDFCSQYKISKERKEVIIKIVNLRIEKLLSLL